MNNERRLLLLKIAAAGAVGVLLLDKVVIGPAIEGWTQQSSRITALSEKVKRGRQLREREASIREHWAGMLRVNLPADVSAAENAAFKAVGRWVHESQVNLTSLTPQWKTGEEGYETLECRVAATGSQAALGHFIYELESDTSVPVNIEDCELTTRDARGAQLMLTAKVSFLHFKDSKNK